MYKQNLPGYREIFQFVSAKSLTFPLFVVKYIRICKDFVQAKQAKTF